MSIADVFFKIKRTHTVVDRHTKQLPILKLGPLDGGDNDVIPTNAMLRRQNGGTELLSNIVRLTAEVNNGIKYKCARDCANHISMVDICGTTKSITEWLLYKKNWFPNTGLRWRLYKTILKQYKSAEDVVQQTVNDKIAYVHATIKKQLGTHWTQDIANKMYESNIEQMRLEPKHNKVHDPYNVKQWLDAMQAEQKRLPVTEIDAQLSIDNHKHRCDISAVATQYSIDHTTVDDGVCKKAVATLFT